MNHARTHTQMEIKTHTYIYMCVGVCECVCKHAKISRNTFTHTEK